MQRYWLEDFQMCQSVATEWGQLPVDVQMVLNFAFDDAVRNPAKVSSHASRICLIAGIRTELHRFRIGYATFEIAMFEDLPPIVTDIDYEDLLPNSITLAKEVWPPTPAAP